MKAGQWGWSFSDLVTSWRLAEQAGFHGLSCFDHISASGERAWEPVTLLGVMAAVTERVDLAVHVLNASLRNPLLLAGQLAVVQAASEGRLRVGLGAGSGFAVEDHRAAGIPFLSFDERVLRLEACCRVLPALWRAESVTDEALGLSNASLGPLDIAVPPVVVGGDSDRILDIAARHADGWNGQGGDVDKWSRRSSRLDSACREAGREGPITKEAQLFADPYLTDDDLDGLQAHLDKLRAAGAERVVLVLHQIRGPGAVERLAAVVL